MSSKSNHASRRWLYAPFIIAGFVLIAYYALWRTAAVKMEEVASQWIEEQRASGMDITHAGITRSGFPFFLRLYVDQPTIITPDNTRWEAPGIFVDALPYDLTRVIFTPAGEQTIALPDGSQWRLNAEDAKASIGMDKARGWVFSVSVKDGAAKTDTEELAIGGLDFDIAPGVDDPTTVTLNLAGQNFSATANQSDWKLDQLNVAVALTRTDLLAATSDLALWRSEKGAFVINALEAKQDTALVRIAGAISLDDRDYPAGRLNTEITNPAVITNWLAAAEILDAEEAELIGAQLTLLSIAGGGKITAPIELENGAAEIGGVTLAQLAPIKID